MAIRLPHGFPIPIRTSSPGNCIQGKPPPPAVRPEKAPPFRRASRLLLKAVHDYEHVHVNVYVGRGVNTPRPLTKPVVVDVLVDVDGF